jgi:23S rRNA (adenine2030-N6)-methyltransferase
MNYRHAFHAGSFADVFKHTLLISLTQAMQRKEGGFCYLDTHAGTGIHDLKSVPAQKSKEYETGVMKIMQKEDAPDLIQLYRTIISRLNTPEESLHFYPGSPYFVKHFLRPQDRMVLTELHEDEYDALKNNFPHDKQIGIHNLDGYQGLKAFLPPRERRGFVLIDPPYEKDDELMDLIASLCAALERWETGTYAVWYPIKEYRAIERFHESLRQRIDRPLLAVELIIYPPTMPTLLNGCGMLFINPPWQMDEEIKKFLPWLWQTLSPNQQGSYEMWTI